MFNKVMCLGLLSFLISCTQPEGAKYKVPFRTSEELTRIDSLREIGWRDFGFYWNNGNPTDDSLPEGIKMVQFKNEFFIHAEIYKKIGFPDSYLDMSLFRGKDKGRFSEMKNLPFDTHPLDVYNWRDSVLLITTQSSIIYLYEPEANVWDSIIMPIDEYDTLATYAKDGACRGGFEHFNAHFTEYNDSLQFFYTGCTKNYIGTLVPGVDSSWVFSKQRNSRLDDAASSRDIYGNYSLETNPQVVGISNMNFLIIENGIYKNLPRPRLAVADSSYDGQIPNDIIGFKNRIFSISSGWVFEWVNNAWQQFTQAYHSPNYDHKNYYRVERAKVANGKFYLLGEGVFRFNEETNLFEDLIGMTGAGDVSTLMPDDSRAFCAINKGSAIDITERNDTLFVLFSAGLWYLAPDQQIVCDLDYSKPGFCQDLYRAQTCGTIDFCFERKENWEHVICDGARDPKVWYLAQDVWGDLIERSGIDVDNCGTKGYEKCPEEKDLAFP